MAIVYLNKDKSILCETMGNDSFFVSSNHTNKKNSQRLVANISRITSVTKNKNQTIVKLNGIPYATVSNSGVVSYLHALTSFETRLFAQGEKIEFLPFQRFNKKPTTLKTDLHTHFAGALTPEQLIESGIGNDVLFPKWILDITKIDYSYIKPNENGLYRLEDIISNSQNRQLLINSMKIDTSEQETFNKMEEIYAVRGPFTKNPKMFIPIIRAIANDCKENGVSYIELSLSSIISDMSQLKLLEENMPKIERETGVQVRFLGALWRHSDKEWNADEVDRLKVTAQSPYVVGCDVMGHETNSTMEFYDNIKELAKYAIQHDPNFVIRVHAGENPLFKSNVRQVLLAVEEAHYELSQQSKKPLPYPQVRLGHGIYGFDEPAPWDEKERTKNISMQQLCDEIKPIIEFNMSSNLSLNNINGISEIPIKKYIDSGIQVVLGTDGKGIYSTDLDQEMILAHQAGLTVEDIMSISRTEDMIIKRAQQRFRQHRKCDLEKVEKELETCYSFGSPQYTEEINRHNQEAYLQLQKELAEKIARSGANTNLQQIEEATRGKIPIMITGSSQKHWPKISTINKLNLRVALNVLIHAIDTDKAYLVTGGTNHGVEKEAHILANRYNTQENGNLIVLGTLTEEAMNTETNSIEPNTITHAMIPTLNGKPAKRWFDLPDTVLNMIGENNGAVVAIGGGPIVSDIIQRAHNLGLNLNLMEKIEGASGDKSYSLTGNDYSFEDAKELVLKLMQSANGAIRSDITPEKLDEMIAESYKEFVSDNEVSQETIEVNKMNTKKVKLISLNPEAYPDEEVECRIIDDMESYVKALIQQKQKVQTAQKNAVVTARPGKIGEKVDTRPRVERNGKIYVFGETKSEVTIDGSMIVKNPDGEEYIVTPKTFAEKYQETETPGVYKSVSKPINYIVLQENVVFKAPWGTEMFALKGGVLNVSNIHKVYAIQNEAFNKTYATLSKNQSMTDTKAYF